MDWNHIHLATNHIPIIGSLFCMIFWVYAWLRKDAATQRMVLWVILFTTLAGVGVKFTGDPAVENIKADEQVIKLHEDWADRATTGIFFWFLISGWGLIQSIKSKPLKNYTKILVTVFGVISMMLLAVAAFYGGKISHPHI